MHTQAILTMLAGAFAGNAFALEDHCSLRLRAVLADGRGVHAMASVTDGTGRVHEKAIHPDGTEFCDLGIKDVRVTVRPLSISCDWSVTMNKSLDWGETARLSVVVPDQTCGYPVRLMQRCTLLLRVLDEDGKSLPRSEVLVTAPETHRRTYIADKYGRVLIPGVAFGAELKMALTANEHKPRSLNVVCDGEQLEKNVELVWAGRR